jgi:hypothetical protein
MPNTFDIKDDAAILASPKFTQFRIEREAYRKANGIVPSSEGGTYAKKYYRRRNKTRTKHRRRKIRRYTKIKLMY